MPLDLEAFFSKKLTLRFWNRGMIPHNGSNIGGRDFGQRVGGISTLHIHSYTNLFIVFLLSIFDKRLCPRCFIDNNVVFTTIASYLSFNNPFLLLETNFVPFHDLSNTVPPYSNRLRSSSTAGSTFRSVSTTPPQDRKSSNLISTVLDHPDNLQT
jgi:hypothetical protein